MDMLAEGSIERVLNTMGAWRCVRFESGNVGVVNSQGRIKPLTLSAQS